MAPGVSLLSDRRLRRGLIQGFGMLQRNPLVQTGPKERIQPSVRAPARSTAILLRGGKKNNGGNGRGGGGGSAEPVATFR